MTVNAGSKQTKRNLRGYEMKSLKTFAGRHRGLAVYVLLMFGSGVWQLLDWHYGTEDPIWHLFFYFLFMPAFSFGYGIFSGNSRKCFLVPFLSGFLTSLVYLFMGNGGFSMDAVSLSELESALKLSVPSFFTASVGVILRRIAILFG